MTNGLPGLSPDTTRDKEELQRIRVLPLHAGDFSTFGTLKDPREICGFHMQRKIFSKGSPRFIAPKDEG